MYVQLGFQIQAMKASGRITVVDYTDHEHWAEAVIKLDRGPTTTMTWALSRQGKNSVTFRRDCHVIGCARIDSDADAFVKGVILTLGEGFVTIRCSQVVLRIPTTEGALESMSNEEKASLILDNDSNADLDASDDSEALSDCIRSMFRETLEEDGIEHSLLPPSWERGEQ